MSYFLIGLLYQFSPSFQMWYIHPPFTISGLPAFRRETFLFPFLAINLCMVVIEKLIGLSEAHRSFSKLPGSPVLFFLFLVITPLQCADILTFLGTIHTNHEIYYVRLFTPFISLAFGYAIWEGWIERERIAEATHRVGTIAQGVAHDLRSPLAVLKNFTHKPYNSDQAHFTLLNLAIERIEGIATNLLDTYKSTDSIVPSSVSQIIQELISTKTIPDRVQIQFTPPANEILCKIGKIELIRALDNLINNAIDAIENVLEPRILIRLTHLGNTAILEVVDNGNGPDEITLRNLNRHNFGTTTKPNGHGIGLSEVWRIVQIHGGTLSFTRNQGGGMCVKMGVKIV